MSKNFKYGTELSEKRKQLSNQKFMDLKATPEATIL